MTSNFKQSTLTTTGTVNLWCESCGHKIEGDPYETSFSGWCCCFDQVNFCSKECWEKDDNMYDTDNWPPAAKVPEGW